jgi:outer membrane lipoprotein-sorting protein
MKLIFAFALSILTLFSCKHEQEKEKAVKTLVQRYKKLNTYKKSVDVLSDNLIKLHEQYEAAEDEIALEVKKFHLLPNDRKLQYIKNAIEKKERVEGHIEKTILEINVLTDSVLLTEKRIQETEGMDD